MSEQTDQTQQTETAGGCGCGCGGHGDQGAPAADERAAAPVVAQPLGAGYTAPEPVTASSMETADPTGIAANVMSVLADGTVQVAVPADGDAAAADASSGVVPGHKAGNILGLRDVSAAGNGGGCGCGGHGHHHHDHAHGEQASGGCACGAH